MAKHFGELLGDFLSRGMWVKIHNALNKCNGELVDDDEWKDLQKRASDYLEEHHGFPPGPALNKAIEVVAEHEGFIKPRE